MQEAERFIEQVRIRRLATQIQYQKATRLKLGMEHNKIEKRLAREVEMLGKALIKLGEYEEQAKNRLSKVQILKEELDFTQEMINETN